VRALEERPCRGCGRPIVMIQNPRTGKWIPLEPEYLWVVHDVGAPHTFMVLLESGEFLARCRRWTGLETDTATPLRGRICHFTTCPQREQFSKVSRKRVLSEVQEVIKSLK